MAGLLLATSTWHVKYTSEIYLEALAALFAVVSVVAYTRDRRTVSAVALGLASAASG